MLKVLIATGGTGGHLFPSQQLADAMSDCEILFAGHKLKTSPFFHRKVPYAEIVSAPSKKKGLLLLKGIFQSLKLIFRFKPDVVVGFGSYHSFPVLMAAVLLRKKMVLFEPNCSLGKVNRFFARFAKKVAFQFPIHHPKSVYTANDSKIGKCQGGAPALSQAKPAPKQINLKSLSMQADLKTGGCPTQVPGPPKTHRLWGWALAEPIFESRVVYVPLLPWKALKARKKERDPARKTILVFGGSQGASFINETFYKAAHLLSFPFQVIHLTGKEDLKLNYSVPAIVKPFEEDMASLYARADFAVCRCGAGTTAELIRYQIPAVVIPYPYAHDHQRKNGEFLKKGVRMLDQKDATPEKLAQEIEALYTNLDQHEKALRELFFPETIPFDQVVRLVGEKR